MTYKMESVKRTTSFTLDQNFFDKLEYIKDTIKKEQSISVSNTAIIEKAVLELYKKMLNKDKNY